MTSDPIETIDLPKKKNEKITLGVISDTHVPDRSPRLHPAIIPILKEAAVSAILHAGDVAIPSVLDELGQVARVIAVRGNRDILLRQRLPMSCLIRVGDVQIGLTHGHGGFRRYFISKFQYFIEGYQADRYHQDLRKVFPQAQAIVFGHSHRVDVTCAQGCLYFNPGAAGSPSPTHRGPSIGLLTIDPTGQLLAEVRYLIEK